MNQLAEPTSVREALAELNHGQLLLLRWLTTRPGLTATWSELLDALGDRLTPELRDGYLDDLRSLALADYDPKPDGGFFATYPAVAVVLSSSGSVKLRENLNIGCKVTLRRERMYEFLDRLVSVALPRVRDFRGVSGRSFDGRGNYALGLKEQIVFPEIDYDKMDSVRGMDIVICTTAKTDAEAKALLKGFDMPFTN